jgi:hypothetical protein
MNAIIGRDFPAHRWRAAELLLQFASRSRIECKTVDAA